MTILTETINKLLRDTVNVILDTPNFTIESRQNAPRPIGSYADVDFISDASVGWERTYLEDRDELNVDSYSEGLREVMMSIGFYRDNSIDNGRKVHIGLTRNSILSMFRTANIGLIRRTEVREISESLENGWEERAQMDVVLSVIGNDADIIESINSLDIIGEFQARGLIYNFNIEVE